LSFVIFKVESDFMQLGQSCRVLIYNLIMFQIRKSLALRTITYTSATKVAMAFRVPFWERENGKENKGGSTKTDLHIKQIFYPQKSNIK